MNARLAALACVAAGAGGGAASSPLLEPQDGGLTTIDATAPLDATPAPEASPPGDAAPADAGPIEDAAPQEDASPPPADPGVLCGKTECDPSTNLCCGSVASYYPQTTYAFACEPLSDLVQCAAGLGIYCDDDHDCDGGTVCCGDLGYNGYTKVSCKATCAGNVYGYQQVHFCDPAAPDCAGGQKCAPSTVLQGYSVCQ